MYISISIDRYTRYDVCVYVCMCLCACVRACVPACVFSVRVCAYMNARMWVCVFRYIHIWLCLCAWVCLCAYAYMHIFNRSRLPTPGDSLARRLQHLQEQHQGPRSMCIYIYIYIHMSMCMCVCAYMQPPLLSTLGNTGTTTTTHSRTTSRTIHI